MQDVDHDQAEKSQHTQLMSTEQATKSPIAEEDEGVETITPTDPPEITSPNQLPGPIEEDADRDISIDDSDLDPDGPTNQFVMASRTTNVGSNQPTDHPEMASLEPIIGNKVISQEDFDLFEKTNPLDAFDFLAEDVLLSRRKSSNVSGEDPSETSKVNLLAEFSSKVLETNLFEAVEQDENAMVR
jgi:hypothetical protein